MKSGIMKEIPEYNLNSLALRFNFNTGLFLLDQTLLPQEEKWLQVDTLDQMIEAIQLLKVRGAPLIGISASLFWSYQIRQQSVHEAYQSYQKLRSSRPTAVNLMNNLDQCYHAYYQNKSWEASLKIAIDLFYEDVELCNRIIDHGVQFISERDQILTHCNTGSLATVGKGTALGIIKSAFEAKKNIHVYVCETRPLGQGARLTCWELEKYQIPYTLITDHMAAFLMQQKKINKVIVGADRIAKNGDVANKIGTYNLAVLSHFHQIPFYVAAPYTTFDLGLDTGKLIPIEERPSYEVTRIWNYEYQNVYNPGFDITPFHLISAIITDKGIISFH